MPITKHQVFINGFKAGILLLNFLINMLDFQAVSLKMIHFALQQMYWLPSKQTRELIILANLE